MFNMRYLYLILVFVSGIKAQERITSFSSDIHVQKDATLWVQETIEVFSQQQKILHGIVREFPTVYSYHDILRYVVGFKLISVTHNGMPVPYHIKHVSNGENIYIGDKHVFLSSGKHTYTITYETTRQLGFFHDFDELYWNVTGNGWKLAIDKVQARIFLPTKISAESVVVMGYTGHQGAQGKNYSYKIEDDCIIFSNKYRLTEYEGFTIAVAFPKGIILPPAQYQKIIWFVQDNMVLVCLCLLLILFLCGIIVMYRKNRPGTVIPLFYPPSGMMPSVVGFMTAKKFKSLFLSADIIDLAVRGFIHIKYNSKHNYTLELLDQEPKNIDEHSEKLLQKLFNGKQSITIKKEYNATIQKALELCQNQIAQEVKPYVAEDTKYWYISLVIYVIMLIFGFIQQYKILLVILVAIFVLKSKKIYFVYTAAGRKVQDAIDGFKIYLMAAEINRMDIIGTPPTKTPELYEKYLPYAVALGIEKQWTLQFSSLFRNLAAQGHPYQPRWYKGYKGKIFVASDFSSDLTRSFSHIIVSSSTPPGTSSGSSGSGSSGGGGGGGGGGGW